MGHKKEAITTGPFKVPAKISGDPAGSFPNITQIQFKNPTTKDFTIDMIIDFATSSSGPEQQLPPTRNFLVPHNSTRVIFLFGYAPNYILRVTVKGDVDEDAEKVEVTVVGFRSSDNMHEPTMFFRHSDFVEVENLHIHADPPSLTSPPLSMSESMPSLDDTI
ncbi:hypothetical protein [Neobacillus bataviensis]|uniref:hypothetical protein n=1 Tax=Neobacillus bataviensis TaxID=220685 RepID=UPI001CBACE61|nr:hypothetical protein [Neobacillus bataviensis]